MAKATKKPAPVQPEVEETKGMRCYLVSCGPLSKLAGTNALAKEAKAELILKTGRQKKDAVVEDHVLPYGKPNLIAYINELRAHYEQKLLNQFNPPGAATKV